MTSIDKESIIKWAIGGFFSGLFGWLFSVLSQSFNPIIILYTIASTIGALILYNGFHKFLQISYEKSSFWFRIKRYNKAINQITENIKKELINKEIYIADSVELMRYFESRIQISKPSHATISIIDIGAIQDSTRDVFKKMVNAEILISIVSYRLLLLKSKMMCIECGGQILFHDKLNHIDIKCENCSAEYRIDYEGLWHLNNEKNVSGYSLYIRTKHLGKFII